MDDNTAMVLFITAFIGIPFAFVAFICWLDKKYPDKDDYDE